MSTPVDDILAHHGVKGMKWGVRKAVDLGFGIDSAGPRPKTKRNSSNVTVVDSKKKLKTYGGKGRPAHPDAISARTIGQVSKKSGVKALSNQELEAYARRLNLEQNVHRLNYNEKSAPRKFIAGVLGRQGSQLANEVTNTGARKAGRGALNRATRKSAGFAKVAATVAAV